MYFELLSFFFALCCFSFSFRFYLLFTILSFYYTCFGRVDLDEGTYLRPDLTAWECRLQALQQAWASDDVSVDDGQSIELGKPRQLLYWKRAAEILVVLAVEVKEVVQAINVVRKNATKSVLLDIELPEVLQLAHPLWNTPSNVAAAEEEGL